MSKGLFPHNKAWNLLVPWFVQGSFVYVVCLVGAIGIYAFPANTQARESAPGYNKNYYDQGDKRVTYLIQSTEHHHLNSAFREAYKKQRWKKAAAELDYVLNYLPNHPKALFLMGSVCQIMGTPKRALQRYEKALGLYPQYAFTHAQYGMYLVRLDRIDSGVEALNKAIQLDPELTVAYVWLAEAYYKNDNTQLGDEMSEKAKSLGYEKAIPGRK